MRLQRDGSFFFIQAIFTAVMCLIVVFGSLAYGEEKKQNLPERSILVSPEYTGVVVSEGEDVSIELTVANRGRRDENIDLKIISIPKGWKARIKTYNFEVTGVHVKGDESKSLTLRVEPEPDVGPGKYMFRIQAQTGDGQLTSVSKVIVAVKKKKKVKKSKEIGIITSYPVLRGPTDAKFEFSLEVENKFDRDSIFNLSSQGPENWEVNFKPAYEEKFISSIRLKANQSKTVAVEVKPRAWQDPGEYPILVRVSSPEAEGEVVLTVVLTGTHKLDAGTANGLLSLRAIRGKAANLSFYVQNTGSAPLNNVRFLSVKPENWKVEFHPEKLEIMAPEELKQVEISITPDEQSLVGDYSVGLSAEAGNASKAVELRVTVRASTAWGWIGIGIIVFVVVGLVILFIRLGRR